MCRGANGPIIDVWGPDYGPWQNFFKRCFLFNRVFLNTKELIRHSGPGLHWRHKYNDICKQYLVRWMSFFEFRISEEFVNKCNVLFGMSLGLVHLSRAICHFGGCNIAVIKT